MTAFRFLAAVLLLAGCSEVPHRPPLLGEVVARQVVAKFRSELCPPFSSATAHRVFPDASWLGQVQVQYMAGIFGFVPLSIGTNDRIFYIVLTQGRSQLFSHVIYLRTTPDLGGASSLVQFFHGQAPRRARVLEYAICYPDGRIENSSGKWFPAYGAR